ncbi:MAG: hypothetical protein KDD34_07525, partial [Bdellovibrionales bacterium]|nr:hypothetical protein [Bdellovibrionales bacterium]
DRFPPQLAAAQVYFQVTKDGYAVTAGDILMGKVLPEQKGIKDGAYLPQETRLWPSSTIPFMIAKEVGNSQPIIEAISYFNQNTPVRFVEVEEGDEEGIIFLPHEELCASHLGRVGGFQPIFISGRCGKSEVIHELMHALGFVHEHSRQDRDRFVKVHWQNIKEEFLFQFNKMPDQLVHNYSGSVFDFDAESIMLYPEEAFAKTPGLKTLEAIGGTRIRPSRNELSRMDRERVYYLYGR